MSDFDPVAWLAAFSEAKRKRHFQGMKDLRRQICIGTKEHCVGLEVAGVTIVCPDPLPPTKGTGATMNITVRDLDCLESERQLRAKGLNPCVLNMASCHRPGGGWLNGAGAQEENLFYRSNYAQHLPAAAYPFKTPLTSIYTSRVLVFRESEDQGYAFSPTPRFVSFIAAAALKEPTLTEAGTLTPADYELTKAKIRQVLRVAITQGHDSVVLSAWGCGAYANPSRSVAQAFKEVLQGDDEFKGQLEFVEFAIFNDHNSTKEGGGNFAVFKEVFDGDSK